MERSEYCQRCGARLIGCGECEAWMCFGCGASEGPNECGTCGDWEHVVIHEVWNDREIMN